MTPLGWIHFSQSFRERVHEILELMEDEGVVDELGVGSFRDGLAELLFPGLSTVQTRAKYFFVVPYIIKDYLNLPRRHQTGFGKYLDDAEHEVLWRLAEKYNYNRALGVGVIGVTKRRGEHIARRPSSVYWNGLRTLGLVQTRLSLAEYSRRMDERTEERLERTIARAGDEGDDVDVDLMAGHGINVPTYRTDWEEHLDMPLDYEEADFLRRQILRTVPGSLLGRIAESESLYSRFLESASFREFARPAVHALSDKTLVETLTIAHDLDLVAEGLHWVYSNEINKRHYGDDSHVARWDEWCATSRSEILDLDGLRGERVVARSPRASYHSQIFITNVLDLIRSSKIDYDRLAELVIQQEMAVKSYKSRFRPKAETDFKRGDQRSLFGLNYRFSTAQTMLSDIRTGLHSSHA